MVAVAFSLVSKRRQLSKIALSGIAVARFVAFVISPASETAALLLWLAHVGWGSTAGPSLGRESGRKSSGERKIAREVGRKRGWERKIGREARRQIGRKAGGEGGEKLSRKVGRKRSRPFGRKPSGHTGVRAFGGTRCRDGCGGEE